MSDGDFNPDDFEVRSNARVYGSMKDIISGLHIYTQIEGDYGAFNPILRRILPVGLY